MLVMSERTASGRILIPVFRFDELWTEMQSLFQNISLVLSRQCCLRSRLLGLRASYQPPTLPVAPSRPGCFRTASDLSTPTSQPERHPDCRLCRETSGSLGCCSGGLRYSRSGAAHTDNPPPSSLQRRPLNCFGNPLQLSSCYPSHFDLSTGP